MHEQSETVQNVRGKWINVYGGKTRKRGQMLPGSVEYDTVEEAVAAAVERSKAAAEDAREPEEDEEPAKQSQQKRGKTTLTGKGRR